MSLSMRVWLLAIAPLVTGWCACSLVEPVEGYVSGAQHDATEDGSAGAHSDPTLEGGTGFDAQVDWVKPADAATESNTMATDGSPSDGDAQVPSEASPLFEDGPSDPDGGDSAPSQDAQEDSPADQVNTAEDGGGDESDAPVNSQDGGVKCGSTLCPIGWVCDLPCGAPQGAQGTCVEWVADCSAQGGTASCGCNRRWFSNDCERVKAGYGYAPTTSCEPEGSICNNTLHPDCVNTDEVCDLVNGSCAGAMSGLCEVKDVPCLETGAPVCGCDGVTYPSDCHRRLQQVPRAHLGSCT